MSSAGLWIALWIPAFVLLWCAIAFIMSRLSGWAAIARAYPAMPIMSPHETLRWQSASLNGASHYNAVLKVAIDGQAMHWSLLPPMRLGHPAFSVPWSDVRAEMSHRGMVNLIPRVALRFEKTPDVAVLISPRLAERIAAASQARFVSPRQK